MNGPLDNTWNVGLVIQNNYPIDSEGRTRKLAKALHRHNKNPFVFARNTRVNPGRGQVKKEYDPAIEEIEYATVHRFSWLIPMRVSSYISIAIPINPFWVIWLLIHFHKTDIDCVITSDIRVSLPAIVAAKLLGIPIITDLRENHVEYAQVQPKDNFIDYLSRHPFLVGAIEGVLIKSSDELWVNVPERKEQLAERGYCPTKMSVISNTPDLIENTVQEQVDSNKAVQSEFNRTGFTLVYVGFISDLRNLSYVVKAVACLLAEGEDVNVLIAGEGPARESLEELCKKLDVEESVHFLGWMEPETVPHFLASGDVGVIPHQVNPFTNTTIPNKLFNYMMVGLPVLATDMDPVSRVVKETECGRIISKGTPVEEVGNIILEVKESDELEQKGRNGYEAVQEYYNWEQETDKILSSIRSITNDGEGIH